MPKIIKEKVIYLLVPLLAIVALYFIGLDRVPVHLNQDEAMFGLNAYSIAQTGNDYYGNPLPFYFWHLNEFWATPIIVYWTSLFLKFLPLSEVSIRLGSVSVALISAALLAVLVKNVFGRKVLTILSAILMLSTPALFINSRFLLDITLPIPFVLLWLIFLHKFQEKGNAVYIFASTFTLGIGIHSYHAAKIIMPLYFIATLFYVGLAREFTLKNLGLALLGFVIPIALFIPWLKEHPDTLFDQIEYASSIDQSVNKAKGIYGVLSLNRAKDFITSYFSYFSPKTLFFEGDRTLIHSTGQTGVFLFSTSLLIIFGVVQSLFKEKDKFAKLVLFGFLTFPMAPAFVNDPQRVSRALVVIVFGVLLSIYGIRFLLIQKDNVFKYLLVAILAFSFIEFGVFLNDYFGQYRIRSYAVFNKAIGSAMESALQSTKLRKVDTIYVDKYIPFYRNYFDFYRIKKGSDFVSISEYDFRKDSFSGLGPGSLVILSDAAFPQDKPDRIGNFEKIEIVREPDGTETFLIYYRER